MNRPTHRLVTSLAIAAAVAASVPGTASAQDPSPQAAYRQALMQEFRLHMGGIRSALEGTAPIGHAEHHAVAFNEVAVALANAFPEGSGGPGSRALPAIWENRMDFMDKVSAIQNASAALVTATRSGDTDRISAAASEVQATCGGCHTPYRAR